MNGVDHSSKTYTISSHLGSSETASWSWRFRAYVEMRLGLRVPSGWTMHMRDLWWRDRDKTRSIWTRVSDLLSFPLDRAFSLSSSSSSSSTPPLSQR